LILRLKKSISISIDPYLGPTVNILEWTVKDFKRPQNGFTLIELMVTISVLAVLVVVATPKMGDVVDDARTVGVEGMAGTLGAAGSINYSTRTKLSTAGNLVEKCSDTAGSLEGGVLPSAYAFTASDAAVAVGPHEVVFCTISTTATPVASQTFLAYGIP
jgi:prepilin-type N-terminal cleavage/methylation domain-containing protein